MTRIFMIRHGQAAASFTDDVDPGLSELGHTQASAVAESLNARGPLKLISSPLARAFQTAEPLRTIIGGDIQIDNRVSEIPSPGLSVSERGPWLRDIMMGTWSIQSGELNDWRNALVACLKSQKEDCAIFSHFVAINVAVGYAENIDQVSVFRPDNTSVTEFQTDGSSLELVERGSEAVTVVN